MEDRAIVDLYWARDEKAIKETESKYSKYLSTIAYNIVTDIMDAQECLNDTYLHAWNAMPEDRPEMLSTYLGKFTRNIAIDLYRKKTASKRKASEYTLSLDELDECISGGNNVEETVDRSLLSKAISDFLRRRSEEKRNIFICRYFYCDSAKDIASKAGMKESSVRSILMRERDALKAYLRKEGFEV
ncbi:MAG: sigma-70 family RNA polymerase sigma factor [Lachnospiraceae bacterium]|nr:sigma-70 family RNA polymerase sigma factor [Lachnospiraceae bacterium]